MKLRDLPENLKLRFQRRFDLVRPLHHPLTDLTTYAHPNFRHTFFGYYDRSPWNEDNSKLLFLATNADDYRGPDSVASFGFVNLITGEFRDLGETSCWNFQQASQQQWVAGDRILLNDSCDGRPITRVIDAAGGGISELPFHSGMAHRERSLVCSYDFGALFQREVDYGYYGMLEDVSPDTLLRIFSIPEGELKFFLSLDDLLAIHPRRDELSKRYVWIQHAKFNPSGTGVLFMLRSRSDEGSEWGVGVSSDLIVWDLDLGKVSIIIPSEVWSRGANHPVWMDDDGILLNLYIPSQQRRRAVRLGVSDRTQKILVRRVDGTGHPTPVTGTEMLLTDSYFFDRVQRLHLLFPAAARRVDLGRYRFNLKFRGPLRCDLHPRWNPGTNQVCFDSTMSGLRCLYVLDLNDFLGGA